MMKKNVIAFSLLSTSLLLTACGNEEESYSREEVAEIVNAAVAEATNQSTEQEEVDIQTDSATDVQAMDTYEKETVRGAFNVYGIREDNFLNEESFTKNGHDKDYDLYSPINHNGLLYNVIHLEVIKYLESDFTSNVLRAKEGKSYIIMQLTGQNIGDRERTIDINEFFPKLWIYDENNEIVGGLHNSSSSAVVHAYLEQYGTKLDTAMRVERLGYFNYTLGFTVKDELLKPGNKLVLHQPTLPGKRLEEYNAAVYQLGSDFELPIVEE